MCENYGSHFVVYRKDVSEHARHCLTGLLGTQRRKNMGRIEEDMPESNYEGLQYFLSECAWEHAPLMAQVAADVGRELGNRPDSALYIEETSFVKKGNASVAVAIWAGVNEKAARIKTA